MCVNQFSSNVRNYTYISLIIWLALGFVICLLLLCNVRPASDFLVQYVGVTKALLLQLCCWGALGGIIASYKCFADDKDINEKESREEKPDPKVLRLPDYYDVHLYALRIVISGVLGLVSGILLYAGLGYFDTAPDAALPKHKAFFAVFAFLAGMQQNHFLAFLQSFHKRLMAQSIREAEAKTVPKSSGR